MRQAVRLQKMPTPRASQHYRGWRAWQKSLLLPVAGEIFLLTLPFIERSYRPSKVLVRHMSGYATNQDLAAKSDDNIGAAVSCAPNLAYPRNTREAAPVARDVCRCAAV